MRKRSSARKTSDVHAPADWCPAHPLAVIHLSWPSPPSFHVAHGVPWCGIPLDQLISDVLAVLLSRFFCTCSLAKFETLDSLWFWVSPGQHQQKHQCLINISLMLYSKHKAVPATERKINAIPGETRTSSLLFFCYIDCIMWLRKNVYLSVKICIIVPIFRLTFTLRLLIGKPN